MRSWEKMLLVKGKEPPAVWQPWEVMEPSRSVQVTRNTSTCCSLPGASWLGCWGPSAVPSLEQPPAPCPALGGHSQPSWAPLGSPEQELLPWMV